MSGQDKTVLNLRLMTLTAIVLAAALSRLMPHPPNIASVAAVALFGGAYFSDRRMAFLVPLAALLLSDGVMGFHPHMEIIYAAFALVVCLGFWLRRHLTPLNIAGAALAGSVSLLFGHEFRRLGSGIALPENSRRSHRLLRGCEPVLSEHAARRPVLHRYSVWRLRAA